jgi:long-chain acyl-CoA synthetase
MLVWFPEGGLSRIGTVQRFRPGIGLILGVQPVPVVPVWIAGSQEALPPDQWRLRRRPIRITFGKALDAAAVHRLGAGTQPPERVAALLRDCVVALGEQERRGTSGSVCRVDDR